MNYKVQEFNIHSENAAKPHTMPSSYLSNYLSNLEVSGYALDFGCGKLRYSSSLVNKFSFVTFMDSQIQLERKQMIRGVKTTVSEYVCNNYPNANTVSFESIKSIDRSYNFILCSNVLSAIPCISTINDILCGMSKLLEANGEALIVNQYKSTYFKKFEIGMKHLYGYIYQNSTRTFYYGLLNEEVVGDLCLKNGLSIKRSWSKNGSSYVIASKN